MSTNEVSTHPGVVAGTAYRFKVGWIAAEQLAGPALATRVLPRRVPTDGVAETFLVKISGVTPARRRASAARRQLPTAMSPQVVVAAS